MDFHLLSTVQLLGLPSAQPLHECPTMTKQSRHSLSDDLALIIEQLGDVTATGPQLIVLYAILAQLRTLQTHLIDFE